MGTGDKMVGGNLRWTSIPSRGSSYTPSWLHATETGISSGSVGQFGPSAALPLSKARVHTYRFLFQIFHDLDFLKFFLILLAVLQ